jgi:hypothetical protein
MNNLQTFFVSGALLATLVLGCGESSPPAAPSSESESEQTIQSALAQLKDEDQSLAADQRFCAVQTHQRLGSMGAPLKLLVEGQPVFICCKGCERKALADPQTTLGRVAALKEESN